MEATMEKRELLPSNVKPTHYALELEPNFTTFKTNGSVTIELNVIEASKEISLHINDIEIESITLQSGEREEKPQSKKYISPPNHV